MTDSPMFGGYAATYAVDRGSDRIEPGAFKRTLPDFLRRGLLCWSHDLARPVGMIKHASEDGTGLRIYWTFHSHQDGEAARTILAERTAAKLETGLSIGYRVIRAEAAPGGIRRLLEIELLEVSIVGQPMNVQANVDLPKGMVIGPTVPLTLDPAGKRYGDSALDRAYAEAAKRVRA